MRKLRAMLYVRLKAEGNQVSVESHEPDRSIKVLLRNKRQALKEMDAERLFAAPNYLPNEVLQLQTKETLTPQEQQGIAKFYFLQFYCIPSDSLTLQQILDDDEGRRRSQIINLECLLHLDVAVSRTEQSITRQASWHKEFAPWDFSTLELKRKIRELIGLRELLEKMIAGWEWTAADLSPYAEKARAIAKQIKGALGFTIHDRVSTTQVIHQLLEQIGIKLKVVRWRQKVRVYALDMEHWNGLKAVVDRRYQRFLEHYTPPQEKNVILGGEWESLTDFEQGLVELLEQALEFGAAAVQAVWADTAPASRLMIRSYLSEPVQRLVG